MTTGKFMISFCCFLALVYGRMGLSKQIKKEHYIIYIFNCYLAAPRPTLGHYRGDSLTHLMLITAFYIFDPKVTRSLVARLGP